MAKESKLARHVRETHSYPYDDAATLKPPLLMGWHRQRHMDEAELEHAAMERSK